MAHLLLSTLVIVLSLVGLWDAIYFTLAYYGRVQNARWVPEILCAREGSSCVTVVRTPYARVFHWPNSLFGLVYYAALIVWVVVPSGWLAAANAHLPSFSLLLKIGLTAVSALTVFLGGYLIYALRAKLHTHCVLCYLAHAINTILLVLIILMAW
ncbi:MAG: vitamin K epoxide reductase family protein [Deltaproteobacteria bacterium]